MSAHSITKKIIALMLCLTLVGCYAATAFAASDYTENDKVFSSDGDRTVYISSDGYLYTFSNDSTGLKICGYWGDSGSLNIPAMINGRNVSAIEKDSFSANKSITSVTIPDNITSIEEGCFNGCTALESVVLSGSVNSLTNCFCDCTSLRAVTIPQGMASVLGSFKNCTSVTVVSLSRSVKDLDKGSFSGCTALKEIIWSNGLIKLNDAFDGCSSLTEVNIPNGINQINGAFDGCISLRSVTFPESLLYITGGFSGCPELKTLTFPDSLLFVNEAFTDCANLSTLEYKDVIFDDKSFTGCPKLHLDTDESPIFLILKIAFSIIVIIALTMLFMKLLSDYVKKATSPQPTKHAGRGRNGK